MHPGVLDGLNALRERSLILACVTNKLRRFTLKLLQAFNLEQYFEYVVCGDDLPVKKPDPYVLSQVLQQTKLHPSQAVMVGDSESDINAAQGANIKSFCVRYGLSSGERS